MSAFFVAQARRLLAARDLEGALAACGEGIAADGRDAEPWFIRGTVELALARVAEAAESAREALARAPQDPRLHVLLGNARHDGGRAVEAKAAYAEATRLAPAWPMAWLRLGTVCFDLGETREAEDAFERALQLDPHQASAWNNLAIARMDRGSLDGAEEALRRALAVQPDHARAFYNLARVARSRNDPSRALELATIAERLDPRLADAALLAAEMLRRRGDAKGARSRLEAVLVANPDQVAARNQLAELLWEGGFAREGREQYRGARSIRPTSLKAALGARLLLPPVYESHADLGRWRGEYGEGLAALEAEVDRFAGEPPEAIGREAQWSNFYLAYQGGEDVELQRRYGDFIAKVLARAFPARFEPLAARPARAKPRIGFFSQFFFNCTAGRYFASWITDLDRARFESYTYYTNEWVADDTRRIAAASDHFRHCAGMPLAELARVVAGDELDVLVFPELGMHAATFALAAMRLAPVQACAWGHPVTSGHGNIDHFLSVEAMEPEGAQASYRERLHTLPGLGTRYAAPAARPASRASLGLPEGDRLYLVPQSVFKIHPDNDALLARVLEQDAGGRLVLFEGRHPHVTDTCLARLAAAAGLSAAAFRARCSVLPYMPHEKFLEVNGACDVMLDTLHWSGGNTSLDALAAGLPVVTTPGRFMRGRQSAAMLGILGLDELAVSPERFVETAVSVARDADLRGRLREAIAARRGLLFDRPEPLAALHRWLESVTAP